MGRVVALVAGAVLVTSALGGWGYVHFGLLAEAENERAQLEEEHIQLKQLADRSRELQRELIEYQRRRETIEKIAASRILWSRKLDEFADIVHNKGDQKEYMVWLQAVRSGAGRTPESPAALQIAGLCGGSLSNLSAFNGRIKDTKDFFEDFGKLDPPVGTVRKFADGRFPNVAWDFSFTMDHKATNWREKQEKQAQ
jgi:Tfp pilus assembly protein PilN